MRSNIIVSEKSVIWLKIVPFWQFEKNSAILYMKIKVMNLMSNVTLTWWIKKLDYSPHPSGPSGPSDHLPGKAVIEFFYSSWTKNLNL